MSLGPAGDRPRGLRDQKKEGSRDCLHKGLVGRVARSVERQADGQSLGKVLDVTTKARRGEAVRRRGEPNGRDSPRTSISSNAPGLQCRLQGPTRLPASPTAQSRWSQRQPRPPVPLRGAQRVEGQATSAVCHAPALQFPRLSSARTGNVVDGDGNDKEHGAAPAGHHPGPCCLHGRVHRQRLVFVACRRHSACSQAVFDTCATEAGKDIKGSSASLHAARKTRAGSLQIPSCAAGVPTTVGGEPRRPPLALRGSELALGLALCQQHACHIRFSNALQAEAPGM